MLPSKYRLFLTGGPKQTLTVVTDPTTATVKFSLKKHTSTTLTVNPSNPALVIDNHYTGHKPNVGIESIQLDYNGALPYITYDSSSAISVTDGQVSGFTNSAATRVEIGDNNTFHVGDLSWEVQVKVHTCTIANTDNKILFRLSNSTNTANVLSLFYAYDESLDNVSFRYSLGTGASATYDILEDSGANLYSVQSNTDYWIKLSSDGLNVTFAVSTDGINYTTLDTSVFTNDIAQACNYTVKGYLGSGDINSNYAFVGGTIDLKETYIKSGTNKIWEGIYTYTWSEDGRIVYLDQYGLELIGGAPQPGDYLTLIYETTRYYPIDEGKVIEVPRDSIVYYEVSHPDYVPATGSVLVDQDKTIYVRLYESLNLEDYLYELTNNDLDMGVIYG